MKIIMNNVTLQNNTVFFLHVLIYQQVSLYKLNSTFFLFIYEKYDKQWRIESQYIIFLFKTSLNNFYTKKIYYIHCIKDQRISSCNWPMSIFSKQKSLSICHYFGEVTTGRHRSLFWRQLLNESRSSEAQLGNRTNKRCDCLFLKQELWKSSPFSNFGKWGRGQSESCRCIEYSKFFR